MQPPIPIGTILQNRYRLLGVLGQGGFGRTYLAEDEGRFKERCALKELIPAEESAYGLSKARELFQREAATLYQIQHPQIPQFRTTFEQDQRLFLVQDYVEGKTYRTLLNDRLAAGRVFLESEMWQFMQQILPVLAHIHSKGLIHRDISPDNIILRESDRLPVLIDFGVVKELATQFQSPNQVPIPKTAVGKFGYAPTEQIQTGRAYPNSDLYSLAVTVLVLLTGKEPRELFNDLQLSWQYSNWVRLSDGFSRILNRMLNSRPGDRYQFADEVTQALMLLTPANPLNTPQQQFPNPPNPSDIHTIAVGGQPLPVNPPQSSNRPDSVNPYPNRVIPEPTRSMWESPVAIIGLGTILAILAGVGSWALVRLIVNRQAPPTTPPTVFATPTPTPTPSLTPTPITPTPEASDYSQRLDVIPGQVFTKQGTLKANSTVNYIIHGQQGQKLNTFLNGEGVLMTILGPDQNTVSEQAKRIRGWKGALPFTGDYTLELSPIKGLPQADYKLNIGLSSLQTPPSPPTPTPISTPTPIPSDTSTPTPTPTPIPSDTPTPTPTPTPSPSGAKFDTQRLKLKAGEKSFSAVGQTSPEKIKRYQISVQKGQVLKVDIQSGAVTLDIRYPNGNLVPNASGISSWNEPLTKSGLYKIDVIASEPTDFTLDFSLSK